MRNKGFTTVWGGIAALAAAVFLLALVGSASGDQPECTGDRHYDGVACCPDLPPPPDTTTTTLPGPEPCPPPPPPPPCPLVTCQCGLGDTINYITVNRCPDVPPAPNYVPCRRKRDGTLRCPRKLTPRRVLAPEGSAAGAVQ